MDSQFTMEHPFCDVKKQVARLCKPLFTHTPFKYFYYEMYFYNGEYVTLGIDMDFFCEAFNRNLLPNLQELQSNTSHYVVVSSAVLPPEALMQVNKFTENVKMGNAFGVYHRLCMLFNKPEYVENFVFGLIDSEKPPIETFMNHTSILEKFCVYFREASRDLVARMKKDKINFDNAMEPVLFNDLHNFKNTDAYQKFLEEIKLKKYQIQGKHSVCSLSEREFECLLWLARDKTAKQISRILGLSARTVEAYLVNVKNKLGCKSKFELIDVAYKNPIIKDLIY